MATLNPQAEELNRIMASMTPTERLWFPNRYSRDSNLLTPALVNHSRRLSQCIAALETWTAFKLEKVLFCRRVNDDGRATTTGQPEAWNDFNTGHAEDPHESCTGNRRVRRSSHVRKRGRYPRREEAAG